MVYEEEIRSPAKKFFDKIGKRNLIIIGVVLLIGVAVWLNWKIFADDNDGYSGYDKDAGMDTTYGDDTDALGQPDESDLDGFFASQQVSRQRARGDALEVLQSVVDNASAEDVERTEALAGINKIAKDMEAESNIETLIIAKGFKQCVAVVNGTKVKIIVASDDLTPSDIAIINEVVYDQTGIKPIDVDITRK